NALGAFVFRAVRDDFARGVAFLADADPAALRVDLDGRAVADTTAQRRTAAAFFLRDRRAVVVDGIAALGGGFERKRRLLRNQQLDLTGAAAHVHRGERSLAGVQLDITALRVQLERIGELLHANVTRAGYQPHGTDHVFGFEIAERHADASGHGLQ